MVQRNILWAMVAGMVLMSGCSQVAPDLDPDKVSKHNVSDTTQIVGDTVTIDENRYGEENEGATSRFNSSSDGFKSIYFGFDEYTISPQMEQRIAADAARAKEAGNSRIKIEGNCDEFGTDEYNYALGLKRAKAVKDAMAAQGVDASRMVIISYGESNPVCNEPTDTCYARNRRADLRLAR
jgi:peptidoglycan-associated lipoprotein